MKATIDAGGVYYKELNDKIHEAVGSGATHIRLLNVNGQRYIGGGLPGNVRIRIEGVPGNDLAAFMDGPNITVFSNAQDGVANTMNAGVVVVHGHAGDVLGYGMRGGKLFVRDDVGYRVGIHMKEYNNQVPVIVAGGCARDFFGEYMAGGVLVALGLNGRKNHPIVGDFCGTGMHGGVIFIRGSVQKWKLGREVGEVEMTASDHSTLKRLLSEFCAHFDLGLDPARLASDGFTKLIPVSRRPYGNLYAY